MLTVDEIWLSNEDDNRRKLRPTKFHRKGSFFSKNYGSHLSHTFEKPSISMEKPSIPIEEFNFDQRTDYFDGKLRF